MLSSVFSDKRIRLVMRLWNVVLITGLAACHIPVYSQSKTSTDYYAQGDYEQAYFLFKNMALTGDHDAQFNIGIMHLKGQFVDKSVVDAFAWIKLASQGGKERYAITADKVFFGMTSKGQDAAIVAYNSLKRTYGLEVLSGFLAPLPLPDEECEVEANPVKLKRARYPQAAINKGWSGLVRIRFNVVKEGVARDIQILSASSKIFIQSTVDVIQKTQWEPKKLVDGTPLFARGLEYRYVYKFKGGYDTRAAKIRAKEMKVKATEGDSDDQFEYAAILNSLSAFKKELGSSAPQYKDANEWFLKAAEAGNVRAQYELGKNFFAGKGCVEDPKKGLAWLASAASSGHYIAQTELAMSPVVSTTDKIGGREYWLRKAVSGGHELAKLYLAWELSTSAKSGSDYSNEALNLLEGLNIEKYFDEVRIEETLAAANAADGNFEQAMAHQKLALEIAEELGWTIPVMKARMDSYKNNKSWVGAYYL